MPNVHLPQWLRRPYAIEVRDPQGRLVICSRAWWLAHIIPKHTELKDQEQRVASAIRSPDRIHQDATHPKRRVYYRHGILSAPYQNAWVRVVVEYPTVTFDSRLPASIITAFASENLKGEEELLWPLPENLPLGL